MRYIKQNIQIRKRTFSIKTHFKRKPNQICSMYIYTLELTLNNAGLTFIIVYEFSECGLRKFNRPVL